MIRQIRLTTIHFTASIYPNLSSEGYKTFGVEEEWSDMGLGEANELAERFDVWETPVVHYALDLSAP